MSRKLPLSFSLGRYSLALLATSLAFFAWATIPQQAKADYVFPSVQGVTYEIQLTDLGTILGSQGSTGLPTGASTTMDEVIGLLDLGAIKANGSGPNLNPTARLTGMFGDLKLLSHMRPTGTVMGVTTYASVLDTTPATGPLVALEGDLLYFGALGRNPLTNPGDAGAGGYLLISDNTTGFAFNGVGSGANETPQDLILNSGGFSVSAGGVATNNDNFEDPTGQFAIDPAHVILASKLEDYSTIAGFGAPSGFPSTAELMTNAPGGSFAGVLFVEIATTGVAGPGTTATRTKGFGFLNVVGGTSAGSFLPNGMFDNTNTVGDVPVGGPAEIVFTINSQLNLAPTTAGPYTEFDSSSNDPANYLGAVVPEPSSILLLGIGAGCVGLAGLRRRSRKVQPTV